MELSLSGFFLGLLLLAIPYYIIASMGLRLMGKFTRALLLLIVKLAVVALCVALLVKVDSPWLNFPFVLLMAVLAGAEMLHRARVKGWRLLLPVAVALAVSVSVFGLYVLFLVIHVPGVPSASCLLPVAGLLLGHVTIVGGKAVDTFYCGLAYHGRLYDYLRSNGATHREAVDSFVRRAMARVISTEAASMVAIVGGSAPVLMWALVLSGVGVITAAALQLLLMIALCAASLTAVAFALRLARHYAFDDYDRLAHVKESMTKDETK